MITKETKPVLIVGAGPTGMTAAMELARFGIPVRLIEVYVPVDACGGMSARTEEAAFREIEAAGGVTTTVVTLATAMAPDFTTELGKQMFAIIQKLRLQ